MRKLLLCVGMLAAPGFMACGDSPPAAAPSTVKAPSAKPAASAPAASGAAKSPAYVYIYNPTGKRDPFRMPALDHTPAKSNEGPCPDPLCQYELDQLTLVAVVTGDADPVAMVEDSSGRGYIIHRNTRMGKQGGRVTQILRDSITITELFNAPDGKITPTPVSMHLKADKAEANDDTDFLTNRTY